MFDLIWFAFEWVLIRNVWKDVKLDKVWIVELQMCSIVRDLAVYTWSMVIGLGTDFTLKSERFCPRDCLKGTLEYYLVVVDCRWNEVFFNLVHGFLNCTMGNIALRHMKPDKAVYVNISCSLVLTHSLLYIKVSELLIKLWRLRSACTDLQVEQCLPCWLIALLSFFMAWLFHQASFRLDACNDSHWSLKENWFVWKLIM